MDEIITVIIPAYNVEKYIKKCLNSVLSQTYKNLEIIIVNDGSTDGTGSIIGFEAKKDNRIRVISQKNKGLSEARNIGIKKASGNFVAFIDGDDTIDPFYIEKIFSIIKKEHSDIGVCGFRTIQRGDMDSGVTYEKTVTGQEATIQLLTKQDNVDIVACNKIYNKFLFTDNNIFYPKGDIHEDTLTTYKLYSKARKVSFIDDALYNYYKRNGSITTSTRLDKSLEHKLRAAEEAKEYFSGNKKLKNAAEIAELLAYYSFIDAMLAKKISYDEKYFSWVKGNKKSLQKNRFITKKLKTYLVMTNTKKSFLYKLFRKVSL